MLQLFLFEKKILTDYHKIFLEIKTVTSQYILIQYFSRKCSITTNTEYICEKYMGCSFLCPSSVLCVCVCVCVCVCARARALGCSVQFSCFFVSILQPHRLQHARLPCPSPSPRACSNSCPLSWWCHSTISSSVVPFSSCLQSFPALGSFPMSQLLSSGQILELQLQHQSLQRIFGVDFL